MTSVITVIGSFIGYGIPLKKILDEHSEKEKTKKMFYRALSNEIDRYMLNMKAISDFTVDEYLPIIDKVCDDFNYTNMNNLVDATSNVFYIYTNLLDAFINWVKGCNRLQNNTGYMEKLINTNNNMIHDLIKNMGNMLDKHNSIKITPNMYTFMKLYEDDVLANIKEEEINIATKEIQLYIDKVKRLITPNLKKAQIERKIKRNLISSLSDYTKIMKQIKLDKSIKYELGNLLPTKFKQITSIIDEIISELEKMEKKETKMKHLTITHIPKSS